MAFTFTQEPNDIDQAYGPVIATTFDGAINYVIHGCVIKRFSDDSVVATLRQTPNIVGYAHFDISKILQNQLSSNPNFESITKLGTVADESFEYYLQAGRFDSNGDFQFDVTTPYKTIFYGRKPFTEVDYDSDPYRPDFTNDGTDNAVVDLGRPLTDRTYNVVKASTLTYKPSYLDNDTDVYRIRKSWDDSYTLSWMNNFRGTPLSTTNGINGFSVYLYAADGSILQSYSDSNLVSNGGGPNVNATDENVLRAEFEIISFQASRFASVIASYPTTAFIYVTPWAFEKDPAVSTANRVYAWNPCRIDIEDGECNDFDPIQVSWTNSFGVKDYFTFEKRNDKRVSINRKEYNKTFSDWNQAIYQPQIYDRGRAVYATSAEETYTANTRYLTDGESSYLQNLYTSPDVKVRFSGTDDWIPVVLIDTQYTERTFRKDKLFQHTINFKLANNQQIQNG